MNCGLDNSNINWNVLTFFIFLDEIILMKITLEERFWSKVAILSKNVCWEWLAGKYRTGYGAFYVSKQGNKGAHRVAWEFTRGPIRDNLYVLHKCNNRGCVNPQHLYVGNQFDNMKDAMSDGTFLTGERCPWAKLTEKDVREIRKSTLSSCKIALFYPVTDRTIRNIRTFKRWKQVS